MSSDVNIRNASGFVGFHRGVLLLLQHPPAFDGFPTGRLCIQKSAGGVGAGKVPQIGQMSTVPAPMSTTSASLRRFMP